MKIDIPRFKKTIIFFLLSTIVFFQSCAFIPIQTQFVEKEIQGRFSITFPEHNQVTQGRFVWRIFNKNDFKIEEFYFMDPWGKTRGILMRKIKSKTESWSLLGPNRMVIDKKSVENWLKKEFELPTIEIKTLILPINIASERVKSYAWKRNLNERIKIITETNLGKTIMHLLPDR